MKSFNKRMAAAFLLLPCVFVLCLCAAWHYRKALLIRVLEDPKAMVKNVFSQSGALRAKNGELLRIMPNKKGEYCLYTPLASHSAELIKAVLLTEDKNFYAHPGFDICAIMRAAWQNLSSGRIVSGASTVTQQLIRISKPRKRTFEVKFSEIMLAALLECELSKEQILEKYLNGVSLFGNVRGVSLAALLLFGKSASMLNLPESAALAAAIQAPGRYNPFTSAGNRLLLKRRNRVLKELLKNNLCTKAQYESAVKTQIPSYRHKMPFNAPHFCDLFLSRFSQPIKGANTTISKELQNFLYQTLRAHKTRLAKKGVQQACAVILNSKTLEILAMCGSLEYSSIAEGFNNACVSPRSGGSVLKPFLYALAFDMGYYPSFVLPDTVQTFKTTRGDYLPLNADRTAYGPVTIRQALGNSLNISAVKMLNMLGINKFCSLLTELGLLNGSDDAADLYGLGLAIGNSEIKMLDLARAYSIFVNEGILKSLRFYENQPQTAKSIISRESAFLTFNILCDSTARTFTFGNPSFFRSESQTAIKTGTSAGYRDCWLVAVNTKYVIAIWAGNFSGKPSRGLSGASACGPIYKNIIDFLDKYNLAQPLKMPSGIRREKICSISGQRAGLFCPFVGYDYFIGSCAAAPLCTFHRQQRNAHELSLAYAHWIKKRRQRFDTDPFKLEGGVNISDPWALFGINTDENSDKGERSDETIIIKQSPTAPRFGEIRIISPHNGDRFVMSGSHKNYALLRAVPRNSVNEVIWLIDGKEYIKTPAPYEAYWPMQPGAHRISALAMGHGASEIDIFVER